jgi:hypothetical protein
MVRLSYIYDSLYVLTLISVTLLSRLYLRSLLLNALFSPLNVNTLTLFCLLRIFAERSSMDVWLDLCLYSYSARIDVIRH